MHVYGAIDTAPNIVTHHFTGETSYADWELAMDDVIANVEYVVGMYILSDRRDAENIPSTQHIRDLVDYLVRHVASFVGCGVAIVAHSEAEFGMSRMAEILAEETGVQCAPFTRRKRRSRGSPNRTRVEPSRREVGRTRVPASAMAVRACLRQILPNPFATHLQFSSTL